MSPMKKMTRTRQAFITAWAGWSYFLDALGWLLGFLWRSYINFVSIPLRAGGWNTESMDLGMMSLTRKWGAILLDHGGAWYHVEHGAFGAVGNGTTDDAAAFQACADAVAALVADSGTFRQRKGGVCRAGSKTYKIGSTITNGEGVTWVGAGMTSTVIHFYLQTTEDGFTWDNSAASDFGLHGGIFDMALMAFDYSTAGQSCRDLVVVNKYTNFTPDRVRLQRCAGRGLVLLDVVHVTSTGVHINVCDGACGLQIGTAAASVSTTARFTNLWIQETKNGPCAIVAGKSIDFFGPIFELAGADTPSGAYGIEIESGQVGLYSPYFEGNADQDVYAGSDSSGTVHLTITNPTFVQGGYKVAGKGGVYLDYVDHAALLGGDYSTSPKPVQMTANCGRVVIDADLGVNVPELTSGSHWRTKANLDFNRGNGFPQSAGKAAVAPSGTAVLSIPTTGVGFFRVYAQVYYDSSNILRAMVEMRIAKEGDANADGGMVTTLLADDSAGNFQVVTGDFAVSFPSSTEARVTYTNNNPAGNNTITFYVEGFGFGGDVSVT